MIDSVVKERCGGRKRGVRAPPGGGFTTEALGKGKRQKAKGKSHHRDTGDTERKITIQSQFLRLIQTEMVLQDWIVVLGRDVGTGGDLVGQEAGLQSERLLDAELAGRMSPFEAKLSASGLPSSAVSILSSAFRFEK